MGNTPINSTYSPSKGFAVTKSDVTVFSPMPRALYVGTGGDVVLETLELDTLTFKNVPDGGFILMRVRRVLAATTAADIVATI